MQVSIKEKDYHKINSFINHKLGLNFPAARQGDLEKALASAAGEFDFGNTEDFINFLLESELSKSELQLLSKHLTIGETYFFREKIIFDILRNILIPDLINKRSANSKKITIWSAGCSSGEEAFSIAIILNEMIFQKDKWDIKIFATDINTDQIGKATKGTYGEWSFRDVQDRIKEKYFDNLGNNKYQIKSHIKDIVDFSYLNLVEDHYPSLISSIINVDVIFCRNVLMYFEKHKREDVITKFYNTLVDGGWLILGLTEIGYMSDKRFRKISLKDAIIFQKKPVGENLSITSKISKTSNINKPNSDKTKTKPLVLDSSKLFKKSMTSYDKGNYTVAAELLEKILSTPALTSALSTKEIEKSYYYLAMTFANLGQLNTALEWCELGISKYKLNPNFYFLKSNLMQGMAKYENAIDALKKAIYLNADYIMAHFSLANIFKKLGREKEADRQFKILLEVLSHYKNDDIAVDSGGMTISRIKEIVNAFLSHNK